MEALAAIGSIIGLSGVFLSVMGLVSACNDDNGTFALVYFGYFVVTGLLFAVSTCLIEVLGV